MESANNECITETKSRISFESLSGEFSSWMAQCKEIRKTISTSIDTSKLSLFLNFTFIHTYNQEKSSRKKIIRQTSKGNVNTVCSCAYRLQLCKVHVTPPAMTQPSLTRIEQGLQSQTRPEQKLKMKFSKKTSS
jgi:hypothetical protein